MASLLDRLQQNFRIESVDIVNFDKVDCEIEFSEPLKVMEILNTRVEEFITLVYFNKRMFVMGFLGRTCIIKETAINTIKNPDNVSFSFSLKRDFLKILEKKEELKFKLKEGMMNWSFKYNDGYIVKTMRPTSSIYEVKKYLDFVLNYEVGSKEGTVKLDDVRSIHKLLTKVESNPMSRNIVLGDGYMYSVLPTYAIFKPCGTTGNTLITESIITNLPKNREEFELRSYKGFTGLMGKQSGIYFIFKSMGNKDLIEPYTKLKIDWIGKIEGMNSVMKVLTFGDKNKELSLHFNSTNSTVTIKDTDGDNNTFISMTEVMREDNIEVNSIIQEFNDIKLIGRVSDRNREHIKALLFKGEEICLMR